MEKIKIPSDVWVGLYAELSAYVEERIGLDGKYDKDGNRLEEYEDEFCTIVDDVEDILGIFFEKENT